MNSEVASGETNQKIWFPFHSFTGWLRAEFTPGPSWGEQVSKWPRCLTVGTGVLGLSEALALGGRVGQYPGNLWQLKNHRKGKMKKKCSAVEQKSLPAEELFSCFGRRRSRKLDPTLPMGNTEGWKVLEVFSTF